MIKIKSLQTKIILPLLIGSILTLGISIPFMFYIKEQNTELVGLTTAKTLCNQIVTLRSFYTAEVVARAKKNGLLANYDFATKENSIPLPATMVKVLGEQIAKDYPGTSIRLYSRYPFPHRASSEKYDEFEKSALEKLEKIPLTPIYKIETFNGRRSMRYAVADVMRASCVSCHNSHPESPKKDWKEGDVRGVVEVIVPVDEPDSALQAGTIKLALIVLTGLLVSIGLIFILIRRSVVKPIFSLSLISECISQGNLASNLKYPDADDEIGKLAEAMQQMTSYLKEMAKLADSIAIGNLDTQVNLRSENDTFGNAFKQMVEYLRNMAQASNFIARGELNFEVKPISEKDIFGNAFKQMVEYLREMAGIANEIAKGDLSKKVQPRSSDDVFGKAFATMAQSLHSIIKELNENTQNLSTAANELLVIALQQNNSISLQAASLERALATLEDIRLVVNQTSNKAKLVVDVSEHSLGISKSGQQALEQTMEAMNKIKDQVQIIVQNILELIEKNIQISEITSAVNDIAEQSNLLAVNAAIEAVKAGNIGKGFGVVAMEVKNLAFQSKEATKKVQLLLNDIQKATTSTITVTKEGSSRVETGVVQVNQANDNIRQLNDVIIEASNSAKQISSATNQQVVSIEQISLVMKDISQTINTTVAASRQQSVTAQNLSAIANNINNIVQRYNLNDTKLSKTP